MRVTQSFSVGAVASVSHQWVPGELGPWSPPLATCSLCCLPQCAIQVLPPHTPRTQVGNGLVLGLMLYSCHLEILNFLNKGHCQLCGRSRVQNKKQEEKGEDKTFKAQTEPQNNTAGDGTKLGSRAEGATNSNEQKIEKIKTQNKTNTFHQGS